MRTALWRPVRCGSLPEQPAVWRSVAQHGMGKQQRVVQWEVARRQT